jgi:hypothetical protein
MSATSGYFPPPATESNCPGPMTRAALLALRTGGQLSVNCHYVITDHVQGTLAAGTTVTLHAVSSSELSEEARVNTLFDNESWFGIYDLDASSIIYLRDNRGNEVDGATQVGQFDWGNTSYSYFKVLEGSSLAVNIGNTAIKQRVTVSGASVLNLTGFTGNISDCEITENAQCSIANTSLTFTGNTVTDSTQVFGSLLTAAGSSVQRCVLRNSSLTLTGAGAVTMFDTDVLSSTVTHNSSGTVLWGTCTFSGGATVQHTGTGAQSLTRVRALDGGQVLHLGGGPMTVVNSEVSKRAYWRHFGTGTFTMTDHTTTGGDACRDETTDNGNITILRGRTEFSGVTRCHLGTITLTDFEVRGTVETLGPGAGGATTAATVINLTSGACERNSKITNLGPGSITGNRVFAQGLLNADANVSIIRNSAAGGVLALTEVTVNTGQILVDNTGTLTCLRVNLNTNAKLDHRGLGVVTATDVNLHTRSQVFVSPLNAVNVTLTSVEMGFSAQVFVRAGSAGNVFLEDAILQRGLIDKRATSTAGTFRFGHAASGQRVVTLDGGTINVIGNANYTCANGCEYGWSSVTNFAGDRDVIHRHVHNDSSTINHTGTGGVAGTFLDDIRDTTVEKFGTLTLSASGAVVNYVNACLIHSNSTMAITGTSTGQTIDRCHIYGNSTFTVADCVAMAHTANTLIGNSTFLYSNVTASKPSGTVALAGGAILNVTNATVAGLVNGIDLNSFGRLNISGTAAAVTRVQASTTATINMPQGTHINVEASMGGTLNVNAGNTTGVYHHTNVTTTTTGANTGRGRDFFNNNIV